MKKHLAILHSLAIAAILAGKKTVETRFSQHRIAPYGVISAGDLVYMKPPGEEIVGQFRVKKVISYDGLESNDVEQIFKQFGKLMSAGDSQFDAEYQEKKQSSKFATIIFIAESDQFITSPFKVKKSDLRGWVVLS